LFDSLGIDAKDAGPLAESWRTRRLVCSYRV